MLSIRMIKKLSSGALGPDEIAELLSSMGIDFEVAHIEADHVPEVFRDAAMRSTRPGAEVIVLSGQLKNGDRLDALMVVQPKEAIGVAKIERVTYNALDRYDLGTRPEPA